ncbi:MAG: selenium metabolism-associated LysR family transcriptional regulator [Desulfatibacillaceae bacterium]|nr:selenium metabolism-associated LysR family transcriptional regulator [Desulfatibacillaceae bacterium]
MDLWQLTIFVNVVEKGSFSKAAQSVHLSQPTVSSHIKDLEEHFGCQLLDRMGRKAVPTRGGEILYRFAKKLLALRDEAQAALAAFTGKPSGKLNIGGSTIPGSYLLPLIIGRFRESYPAVSLTLSVGDSKAMMQKTLEGEVEAAVVGAPANDKRLAEQKIADDAMRLIVWAGHPFAKMASVSFELMAKEPFVLREEGSGTRKSLETSLARAGFGVADLTVAAHMGSTEAVRQAVKARLGVSILSTRAVAEELESKTLVAVDVPGLSLDRAFYLITRKQRTLSPVCAAFCDFVLENAPKL